MKPEKSSNNIYYDFTIADYEKKLEKVLQTIEHFIKSENLTSKNVYEITTSLVTINGFIIFEHAVKIISLIYKKLPVKNFNYYTIKDKNSACNQLRIIIQITLL